MKSLLTILTTLFLVETACAAPVSRWNNNAVALSMGYSAAPAILSDRGPYSGEAISGDLEISAGFVIVLAPDKMLQIDLSRQKGVATLENSSAAHSLNYLDVDVDLTTLWVSLQNYTEASDDALLQCWYGGGIHVGILEEGTRERIYVSGAGYYRESRIVESSPYVGLHASAGCSVYPWRNSAISLTVEARMNCSVALGDFKGSLISPAILLGLKYDFGLNSN